MDSTSMWELKKSLFLAALELPVEQWGSFLATPSVEESIRTDVNRMLQLHLETGEFLRSPFEVGQEITTASGAIVDPYIGQCAGGFLIQRHLGTGGMGSVLAALQTNPSRQVAVKILNPGLRSAALRLRRFDHEVAILARFEFGHACCTDLAAGGSSRRCIGTDEAHRRSIRIGDGERLRGHDYSPSIVNTNPKIAK